MSRLSTPFIHNDVGDALGPSGNPSLRSSLLALLDASASGNVQIKKAGVTGRFYNPPQLNLRKRLKPLANAASTANDSHPFLRGKVLVNLRVTAFTGFASKLGSRSRT